MSDAIGGGGGGGSDPFGMLQQILDPLGLFKGIGGGIDKLLKQGGDTNNISAMGKQILSNDVSSFAQADGAASGGTKGFEPVETEYQPGDDAGADRGWSPEQGHESSPVAQGPSRQIAAGQSEGAGAQRLTPQIPAGAIAALQAAVDPKAKEQAEKLAKQQAELKKLEEQYAVMEELMANFQAFDTQGWDKGGFTDSKFDRLNLENVANDPAYPKSVRDAAQYLLVNPGLLRELQAASGGGSGMVVLAAVQQHAADLMGRIQAKKGQIEGTGSSPAPGTTPPPGPPANPPSTGGSNQTGGPNQAGGSGPTTGKDYSGTTLEAKLQKTGESLEDKQAELLSLLNKPEEELTSAQKSRINVLNLEIQKTTDRFKMLHDLISNLQKAFHDMSMHAIGNIR